MKKRKNDFFFKKTPPNFNFVFQLKFVFRQAEFCIQIGKFIKLPKLKYFRVTFSLARR